MHPGLLIGGAFCGVVAIDGIQGAHLKPARQEIGGWRTCKSADIIPNEREPGDSHTQEYGGAHSQMIPSTAVIARPRSGIALRSGIRGAGKHEWPFLRLKFAQT